MIALISWRALAPAFPRSCSATANRCPSVPTSLSVVFFFPGDQRDQQAVQDIAGIVISRCEQCFADQLQQARPGERRQPFTVDGGKRWIIRAGKADDLELALPRLDGRPVIFAGNQINVTARQFLDDFVQLFAPRP